MSPYRFSFEPAYLVLAAAAGAAYVWSARRDRPGGWRAASFVTGLLLIAVSLNSPLETIAAERLLLIHLVQNGLIADVAPPLVLLGLTAAMRAWLGRHGGDPARVLEIVQRVVAVGLVVQPRDVPHGEVRRPEAERRPRAEQCREEGTRACDAHQHRRG